MSGPRRHRSLSALAIAAVVAALAPGALAGTGPQAEAQASPPYAVSAADITGHLEAFQAIADANDGTRAFDTPGYQASVDYVVQRLEAAGFEAEIHEFVVPDAPIRAAAPVVERTAPTARTYVEGTDYEMPFPNSPIAVEGDLHVVEDGCDADQWEAVPAGTVVLVATSPDCPVLDEVGDAGRVDAVGVLVAPGDGAGAPPDDLDLDGLPFYIQLATMSVSGDVATELALLAETDTVRMALDPGIDLGPVTSYNVLADWPGTTDEVVIVGGHLDSVPDGPGINDNGSGAAGVLALAERFAATNPATDRTVRFAFWGAEETPPALLGSTAYVASRTPAELTAIVAYLNVDMIGSPNWMRGVTDPAAFPDAAHAPGSQAITDAFVEHFAADGKPVWPFTWNGNSDDYPFALAGIPTGGLTTGAGGNPTQLKTPEQAALFGGTAGEYFDACYHDACDDLTNVDADIAAEMTGALGAVALELADAGRPTGPVEPGDGAGGRTPAPVLVPAFTG
ncbi:M20/M25/M40 family metallo-hydrolase [Rhabdothermincola salaria]|uniref:M20/M25/M40 family metallo-hydrolase n=1 Tax=Rhabdothermincola salaria TaxID=2903142 RepID=UPI001E556003|nr:M20/M25/M40 family metallo-hydrolase [Rhabdothermincola salaria]MCD9623970.1 M20/M25/M40 family metallo-hydrolase [Rhabdothermincola salaria]